jgi:hypothetical protein
MTSHHKLTAVLHGRTVTGTQPRDQRLSLAFDEGSTMTVKTAGTSASAATGGTIAKVRQQGTEFALDFEDGSTMPIPLAEATCSVMVQANDHTLEYAG